MSKKARLQRSAQEHYNMSRYWMDMEVPQWAIYHQNEAAWYYEQAMNE